MTYLPNTETNENAARETQETSARICEMKGLEVEAVTFMLVGGTLKSAVANVAMSGQAVVDKVSGLLDDEIYGNLLIVNRFWVNRHVHDVNTRSLYRHFKLDCIDTSAISVQKAMRWP